jgi:hypothetical protein
MRCCILIAGLWMNAASLVQAADLADLAKSFAGQFDSRMQWDLEDNANILERDRHPWTTAVHTPVTVPALGTHVFYVEEYRDGKMAKVVRQRLVSFVADGDLMRMSQYQFKTPAQVLHAQRDPQKLATLTVEQLVPMNGCDVVWVYDADSLWTGVIPGKTCLVPGAKPARYVEYRVSLNPVLYQRVDRELFVDTDALAAGFADDLPTVHARVAP